MERKWMAWTQKTDCGYVGCILWIQHNKLGSVVVVDAAATRAANKIWRSIFLYVCVLRYDIDLTDKSFRARVNPQKTSKEKYDNKTSFRSLLWIKEEKMSNHITKEWSDECMDVGAYVIHISLLMSVVGWFFLTPKYGNIILQVIYGKKFPHFAAEDQDAILCFSSKRGKNIWTPFHFLYKDIT